MVRGASVALQGVNALPRRFPGKPCGAFAAIAKSQEGAGMQNGADESFKIRFDAETSVVRVWLNAELDDETFTHYRDEMARALQQSRAAGPAVRVLIDARGLEAMPANSPDRIAELSQLFAAQDRIAMVVRSSLLKIETRRVAHSDCVQGFVSENAAWTWLMAYDVPNASAA
jgi:hypothetical protein